MRRNKNLATPNGWRNKLVDRLYNTAPILDKYKKLQLVPMSQEELAAFQNKVDNFCDKTKNWSKKSQKSGAHWQQGTPTEMLLRGRWTLDPFQRQGKSVVSGEAKGRWQRSNSKVFH
jgi:hypothetical protein